MSSGVACRLLGLLSAPQLLILDDPFTGLDAGFRRLRDLVTALMENETVLIIASDPDEIPERDARPPPSRRTDPGPGAPGPPSSLRMAILMVPLRAPSVEPRASMPCPSDHDAPTDRGDA